MIIAMSWYDETAEQRERAGLPRYIARPPAPKPPWPVDGDGRALEHPPADQWREFSNAMYHWRERSWELYMDIPRGGWGDLVRAGWKVPVIHPERRMDFQLAHESPPRDEINRWADGFINETGTPGLLWPEDREAVLLEVARRLREATADGFL